MLGYIWMASKQKVGGSNPAVSRKCVLCPMTWHSLCSSKVLKYCLRVFYCVFHILLCMIGWLGQYFCLPSQTMYYWLGKNSVSTVYFIGWDYHMLFSMYCCILLAKTIACSPSTDHEWTAASVDPRIQGIWDKSRQRYSTATTDQR